MSSQLSGSLPEQGTEPQGVVEEEEEDYDSDDEPLSCPNRLFFELFRPIFKGENHVLDSTTACSSTDFEGGMPCLGPETGRKQLLKCRRGKRC